MATSTERSRRLRLHRRDDHSLCLPTSCARATGAMTPATPVAAPDATPVAPPGLGRRGKRLWREVTAGAELGPTDLVLLEEACRTTDRLDRLDAFLRGDSDRWIDFRENEATGAVVVVIDKALSEARQQQLALKGVVAELRTSQAAAGGQPSRPGATPPANGGPRNDPAGTSAVVDTSLAARIANKKRRGQPTG